MEKDSSTIFRELKEDVSTLTKLKLQLIKLNTYEKMGTVVAVVSDGLALLVMLFSAFLFIFLALSIYLETVFDVDGCGFMLVSCLYLFMALLLVLNKKRVQTKVLNIVIAALISKEEKKNDPKPNEEPSADSLGEVEHGADSPE